MPTELSSLHAFASFAKDDEENNSKFISRFCRTLEKEVRTVSGEQSFQVFYFTHSLKTGDKWPREIDDALAHSVFFVPFLSPTYFKRDNCRKEAKRFLEAVEREKAPCRKIVPVYFADIPEYETEGADQLMKELRQYHYRNWRELRVSIRNFGIPAARLEMRTFATVIKDHMAKVPGSMHS